MNWREEFRDKVMTADEAMKLVKKGDRVAEGDFCDEPVRLTDALVKRAVELGGGIELCTGGNIGPCPHLKGDMYQYIHFNSLFATADSRPLLDQGRADFVPVHFNEWGRFFSENGPYPVDVALIQLSTPDENGNCCFGVSCDIGRALVEQSKLVIAQINSNVPHLNSDTVHLSELDCIVPYDEPLVQLPADELNVQAGEVETAICKNIVDLVEDGSTLQIGRGKLPDFIMKALETKNDLGVHSEMISNGVMALMEKGVVTNKYKKIFPGISVCTFIGGDAAFYRWADGNPKLMLRPVSFTNDPYIISQNPKVVSINGCLEIDLLGQAAAETIGPRQYSGIGGFNDFVRGARRCKDGKTILVMPSTGGKGKFSRISPFIKPGGAICATRFDTDYVVTEYGVAELWGKTTRQRAEALIEIAHPSFRDELRDYAKKNKLIW